MVVNAAARQLRIFHQRTLVKVRDIKGLFNGQMTLTAFVHMMADAAQNEGRRLKLILH